MLALTEEIQMCGRFTFQPTEAVYGRFQISNRLDSLTARYNIAPGQMVPVIIADSPRRIVLMRWGLIPHWAKDAKTAYKMINPRVETLMQRPAFRGLLNHNRCLVPATGYYKWKAEGNIENPYYIDPADGLFAAFAELYDTWTDPQGKEIQTFTIVTRDADDFMARLRYQMPLVLAREEEQAWLAPRLTKPSQAVEDTRSEHRRTSRCLSRPTGGKLR
jgi:putative SOS response-associated peptidase YedK